MFLTTSIVVYPHIDNSSRKYSLLPKLNIYSFTSFVSGKIVDGSNGDVTADHYPRYKVQTHYTQAWNFSIIVLNECKNC